MILKEHPLKGRVGKDANRWEGGKSRSYNYKIYREKAEKALGKTLPNGTVVHHHDPDITKNKNCNLVLCENNSYHTFLHGRTRAFKACGHSDWLKCTYCKKYDDPKNLYIRPDRNSGVHRACENKYYHSRKRHDTP